MPAKNFNKVYKTFENIGQDKLHCKWRLEFGEYENYYETECGYNFITPDVSDWGNQPIEYCPYCGRWIKEVKA